MKVPVYGFLNGFQADQVKYNRKAEGRLEEWTEVGEEKAEHKEKSDVRGEEEQAETQKKGNKEECMEAMKKNRRQDGKKLGKREMRNNGKEKTEGTKHIGPDSELVT